MKTLKLEDIAIQHKMLLNYIHKTPILNWNDFFKDYMLDKDTEVIFKCELFQKSGTFKLRGALSILLALNASEKQHGVVAGTGGNHGTAVAMASNILDINAKIIVPKTMNALRYKMIKALQADIIEVDKITEVFDKMDAIAKKEQRVCVHPFNDPLITLGTATLGYEFLQQAPDLDILLIAIGGGGLASGVACAAKLINPNIKVYGIEPEGANAMFLSFQKDKPVFLDNEPLSIADSLCAPGALAYSFNVCKAYIDDIVLVTEQQIRASMKLLFEYLNLVCEPACAVTTAAMFGALKKRCLGKRVGMILCGSNIDTLSFNRILNEQ